MMNKKALMNFDQSPQRSLINFFLGRFFGLIIVLMCYGQEAEASYTLPVTVFSTSTGQQEQIVFEWPMVVQYRLSQDSNKLTLVFKQPANLTRQDLQNKLPLDIELSSLSINSKETRIELLLPMKANVKQQVIGPRIIFNLTYSFDQRQINSAPNISQKQLKELDKLSIKDDDTLKNEKSINSEVQSKKIPEKTPKTEIFTKPSSQEQISQPPPQVQTPKPEKPIETKPVRTPPSLTSESANSPVIPSQKPSLPDPMPLVSPPLLQNNGPDQDLSKQISQDKKTIENSNTPMNSLSFSWDKPTGMALFERTGYLWIIFDHYRLIDLDELRKQAGTLLISVEQLPRREATYLRLIVKSGIYPMVRQEGRLWILDLSNQKQSVQQKLQVKVEGEEEGHSHLSILMNNNLAVLNLIDPEVGDLIRVIPGQTESAGISPKFTNPDFDMIETYQGIAVIPHSDGIGIKASRTKVIISGFGGKGLRLSKKFTENMNVTSSNDPQIVAKDNLKTTMFDLVKWRLGRQSDFDENRKNLLHDLSSLSADQRSQLHLKSAKFFFAHGDFAQANGYLKMIENEDKNIATSPEVLTLRLACESLLGHINEALLYADHPKLIAEQSSQFWRAVAHATKSDSPGDFHKELGAGLPQLWNYPHNIRWHLANLILNSAILSGDSALALDAFDLLGRDHDMTPQGLSELTYRQGQYQEMLGKYSNALQEYEAAAALDNREYQAKSKLAIIELKYKLHKITADEAADQLDKMRFAWREDGFEYILLCRYADYLRESKEYANGMRTLRNLIDYYPDPEKNKLFNDRLHEIFENLFLNGGGDSLPPISVIALYDEFQDLTPLGEKGDRIIRKLADRLASVDLLERAADLLKNQVEFRLQGIEKSRVGAQLAIINLLNKDPQSAINALHMSQNNPIPSELVTQRNHIEAQALSDLGKPAEAISILSKENSREADILRSDIFMQSKEWQKAELIFSSLVSSVSDKEKIDDENAGFIMRWATALVFDKDEGGLAELRKKYSSIMDKTKDKDGFILLTSALNSENNLVKISEKIKELENFHSFLDKYHQKIESGELSKIN